MSPSYVAFGFRNPRVGAGAVRLKLKRLRRPFDCGAAAVLVERPQPASDRFDDARIGTELAEERRDAEQRAWVGAALDRALAQLLGERVTHVDPAALLILAAHPPQPRR